MATFPGGVISFTTKTANQSIDAGHINDLQDEVTAIEGGLRNGTAPLNSSNSTFVAISLTGNSTFAGALNITGNSTFSGTVNISSGFQVAGQAGSSGTVLTSQGGSSSPTWTAGSGIGGMRLLAASSSEGTTTSSGNADLITLSSLSISTASGMLVVFTAAKSTSAADVGAVTIKVNSTIIMNGINFSGAAQNSSASSYWEFTVGPRGASYPFVAGYRFYGNDGVNGAQTGTNGSAVGLADAAITSVTIAGRNLNGLATVRVANVKVYELQGS